MMNNLFQGPAARPVVAISTVLAFLCLNEGSYGQNFSFINERKREITSFKLINNLIIVPVYINGKGPYNFILDTGVGIFLISDPSLMASLDTSRTRTIKIHGIGEGNEMTAIIQPRATIELGNFIKGEFPVAILKEDPLIYHPM